MNIADSDEAARRRTAGGIDAPERAFAVGAGLFQFLADNLLVFEGKSDDNVLLWYDGFSLGAASDGLVLSTPAGRGGGREDPSRVLDGIARAQDRRRLGRRRPRYQASCRADAPCST